MAKLADESKLYQDRQRGDRAKALLEDSVLGEAFDGIIAEYINEWRTNRLKLGPEGREELWRAVQLVDRVKGQLETFMSEGSLADADLQRLHPNHMEAE